MPLVRCKLGGTTVTVGNANYSFERDAYGRFVAPVHDLHHFKCLIGLDPYEEVPEIPADIKQAIEKGSDDTLIGSDAFSNGYLINDVEVPLGDLVASAFATFGGTLEEWNALEQEERDTRIDAELNRRLGGADADDTEPPAGDTAGDASSPPPTEPSPAGTEPEGQTAPTDNLEDIAGIGPKTAEALAERGITTFMQIATLTDEEVAKLNDELELKNSIVNNDWRGQAAQLEEAKASQA